MNHLVALVLTGHLLGDWVVQTDRQAARKALSWAANQAHVATYHAALAACVAPVWHDWKALAALAVSWVTHSFLDRRWPVRWLMEHTGSRPFSETTWGVLVVDQALHLSILLCLTVVT